MIKEACPMEIKAFGNVKNQIGRCGIWCGSCAVGNGTLRNLAKRSEHLIGGYGVDKWGATDFDGKEFMKGLKSIQNLPTCVGCLKGGGNEVCKIRPCTVSRKLSDCTVCNEKKTCKNLEALQKVCTGALRVGMLARFENDKTDRQELIKKWTAEIKSRCKHCGA
jgi:hypothetical protein